MKKELRVSEKRIFILTLGFLLLFIMSMFFLGSEAIDEVYKIENFIFEKFHYIFFDVINIVIIALLVITFTKFGKVRIGGKEAKPLYSNFAWYAMLFSAGMGIGIMFYAVAEPVLHTQENPLFTSAATEVAALSSTYFSWGIHAWAVYCLLGLAFAYFTFNKKLPLTFKSLFYPILKDNIYKWPGDIIDTFGIIITLFALSSSLGLGSIQINSGLNYLFGVPKSIGIQIIIIVLVMCVVTYSVLSGVGKGVRIFSENNLKLAAVLAIFLFLLGPTIYIIKGFVLSTGVYTSEFIKQSLSINHVDSTWTSEWSIFYMAWWVSWSIFVGIFIAKISKGRTIREFILSILLIPTILSMIWFSILGINGIFINVTQPALNFVGSINEDISLSLFIMIDYLVNNQVLTFILQILSLVIIVSFFITSSDSGAIVVNEIASQGDIENKYKKVFWTALQGILTIVLLVVGGTQVLDFIQQILIIVAFPMTLVLLYIVFLLLKEALLRPYINFRRYLRKKLAKNKT